MDLYHTHKHLTYYTSRLLAGSRHVPAAGVAASYRCCVCRDVLSKLVPVGLQASLAGSSAYSNTTSAVKYSHERSNATNMAHDSTSQLRRWTYSSSCCCRCRCCRRCCCRRRRYACCRCFLAAAAAAAAAGEEERKEERKEGREEERKEGRKEERKEEREEDGRWMGWQRRSATLADPTPLSSLADPTPAAATTCFFCSCC